MRWTITFEKWGRNLGICLPSALAREMHLAAGTVAEMSVKNGQMHIRPQVKSTPRPRLRRPLSFYEQRARELGLTSLIQAVEIMPDDAPRGRERL